MTEEIKANINNPEILEKMYRDNPTAFEEGFEKIYPENCLICNLLQAWRI